MVVIGSESLQRKWFTAGGSLVSSRAVSLSVKKEAGWDLLLPSHILQLDFQYKVLTWVWNVDEIKSNYTYKPTKSVSCANVLTLASTQTLRWGYKRTCRSSSAVFVASRCCAIANHPPVCLSPASKTNTGVAKIFTTAGAGVTTASVRRGALESTKNRKFLAVTFEWTLSSLLCVLVRASPVGPRWINTFRDELACEGRTRWKTFGLSCC